MYFGVSESVLADRIMSQSHEPIATQRGGRPRGAEAPEASEAIGLDEVDELEVDGMVLTAAILLGDAGTSRPSTR